jgi:hypothetical protein
MQPLLYIYIVMLIAAPRDGPSTWRCATHNRHGIIIVPAAAAAALSNLLKWLWVENLFSYGSAPEAFMMRVGSTLFVPARKKLFDNMSPRSFVRTHDVR